MNDTASATTDKAHNTRCTNGWRIAGWGALGALLALPAIAMQLTGEVQWTTSDFIAAAVMLVLLGAGIELGFHFCREGLHRAGAVLSAFVAFLTIWIDIAVGIIGDGPINLAFYAMLLAALVAAILARFRAAAAMWIAATLGFGQLAVGLAAELGGYPDWFGPVFFAAWWALVALLFGKAAAEHKSTAA
ncbi:hypothetical protein P7228_08465 [Altererythrobacter arenosus]|uniref:DUF2878 domain-containing protein n=1 Tax=Altererythrobacter arenosus TaxID=3032592 RepID=A0ABY8FSK9_9SPHN|nr:hypothetical protein [Altererythrobacter sp. CAU 1644]WFL76041.1 hypothetical protein P7228_08465 [Altererythrobacter sp. CAU 1644]